MYIWNSLLQFIFYRQRSQILKYHCHKTGESTVSPLGHRRYQTGAVTAKSAESVILTWRDVTFIPWRAAYRICTARQSAASFWNSSSSTVTFCSTAAHSSDRDDRELDNLSIAPSFTSGATRKQHISTSSQHRRTDTVGKMIWASPFYPDLTLFLFDHPVQALRRWPCARSTKTANMSILVSLRKINIQYWSTKHCPMALEDTAELHGVGKVTRNLIAQMGSMWTALFPQSHINNNTRPERKPYHWLVRYLIMTLSHISDICICTEKMLMLRFPPQAPKASQSNHLMGSDLGCIMCIPYHAVTIF